MDQDDTGHKKERFEMWLRKRDSVRLELLAKAYGRPRVEIVRAGLYSIFIEAGLSDPFSTSDDNQDI